jgi:hypothetical protein
MDDAQQAPARPDLSALPRDVRVRAVCMAELHAYGIDWTTLEPVR